MTARRQALWRKCLLPSVALVHALVLLADAAPIRAQAQPPAAASSSAEALEKRAAALRQASRLVEAEQLYLDGVRDYQKRVQDNPDDPAAWVLLYRLRNDLADVRLGMQKFREGKELLSETLTSLKQFVARRPDDDDALAEFARTYRLLDDRASLALLRTEATEHSRSTVQILQKLAARPRAPAEHREQLVIHLTAYAGQLMLLARYPEATAAYEQALELGKKLVADSPDSPGAVRALAVTYNSYALLVRESGQFASAADMIREAIRLLSGLEKRYPDRPEYWRELATFYHNLAQPLAFQSNETEAALARREAVRVETRLSQLSNAAGKAIGDGDKIIGVVQDEDATRLAAMGEETERCVRAAEKDFKEHPEVPLYRAKLAAAKMARGLQLCAAGKSPADALGLLREALDLSDQLAAQYPDLPLYRRSAAATRCVVGMSYLLLGQASEGEQYLREGIDRHRKLADDCADAPEHRYQLSDALLRAATLCGGQGNVKAALPYLLAAGAEMKKLADAFPDCQRYRRDYAQGFTILASAYQSMGETAEAEAALREAARLWRILVTDFPKHPEFRQSLGHVLSNLGGLAYAQGRFEEAGTSAHEVLQLHQELVKSFPAEPGYRMDLAKEYNHCGQILEVQGRYEDAVEHYAQSVGHMEASLKMNPRRRDWVESLRVTCQLRAAAYQKLGKNAESQQDLRRAKELEESLQPPLLRFARVGDGIAQGKPEAAVAEAEDLFLNSDLSASQFHDLAALFARAAAAVREERDKDRLAARAVEALRRAYELGYVSLVRAEDEEPFRPLASRDDFKKLVDGQRR